MHKAKGTHLKRGLNRHLHRYCKDATDDTNNKQEHSGILQQNFLYDPSINEDNNPSTNVNSYGFDIEPVKDSFLTSSIISSQRPSSTRRPNNKEELKDEHHGEESTFTILISSSSNQLAIYNQECLFLESNVGVWNTWCIHDLSKIDHL